MKLTNLKKPKSPNFSSGPTKKPDEWSIRKLNTKFLGRYHRSNDVKDYIKTILQKLKKTLNIPNNYEILLFPGSCTGAMEAVIWSMLGERNITSIIYDYWGETWQKDLQKLNCKIDMRKNLGGILPDLKKIPKNNDVLFVWSGTSNGMCIENINFIEENHDGLIVSDITSAVFIYDLPWKKLDISVFSWQKALGSESQHGIIVMSPKALTRIKKKQIPKVLSIFNFDFLINTPSLLSLSDFDLCLDIFIQKGGLKESIKTCLENQSVIEEWVLNNNYVDFFCKVNKFRAVTPSYLIFKKKLDHKKIFSFLSKNAIAYDIENYRKAKVGIRVWNGPNIKKNDLIALTNWLDWCFNKFKY